MAVVVDRLATRQLRKASACRAVIRKVVPLAVDLRFSTCIHLTTPCIKVVDLAIDRLQTVLHLTLAVVIDRLATRQFRKASACRTVTRKVVPLAVDLRFSTCIHLTTPRIEIIRLTIDRLQTVLHLTLLVIVDRLVIG